MSNQDPADGPPPEAGSSDPPPPPSLDTTVRRRRADHDFYLRLASAIQGNEQALRRLR
jgi:hypothetical protein